MTRDLALHAIILALNEEHFIEPCIAAIYDHCSRISVVTQYDRNWYGEMVHPDATVAKVLAYPDPEGRISLTVQRHVDEAAARNQAMVAASWSVAESIDRPHATDATGLANAYRTPDYFLIVDADEIFDIDTFPSIVDYLAKTRPRVLHVNGYEYARSWNRRVPPAHYVNTRIGFVRAGLRFCNRRVQSYHHIRLSGLANSSRLFKLFDRVLLGNRACPPEIGVFHHGALIKSAELLQRRAVNHSERRDYGCADNWQQFREQATEFIPLASLPRNIAQASWPNGYLEEP